MTYPAVRGARTPIGTRRVVRVKSTGLVHIVRTYSANDTVVTTACGSTLNANTWDRTTATPVNVGQNTGVTCKTCPTASDNAHASGAW